MGPSRVEDRAEGGVDEWEVVQQQENSRHADMSGMDESSVFVDAETPGEEGLAEGWEEARREA